MTYPSDGPPPPPPPPPPSASGRAGDKNPDRVAGDRDAISRGSRGPGRLLAAAALGIMLIGALAFALVTFVFDDEPSTSSAPLARAASTPTTRGTACGSVAPPAPSPRSYESRPPMKLNHRLDYEAVIHTSCGDFKMDLLEHSAPRAVNNFVFLAEEGFYEGLTWHQVVTDSIIQTGDPNGQNGVQPDGPGYSIRDELGSKRQRYVYGDVGYALVGGEPDTAGSQFFVIVHDLKGALKGRPEPLDIPPKYTVFGRVPKKFFGSLNNIATQPTLGSGDAVEATRPAMNIYINEVEIRTRRT